MINRCLLLMSMYVMTSQLMSMEELCINTADELKVVARTVRPEEYGTRLKMYTINPNAVSQSLSALLEHSFLPDGMSTHVETTCNYNSDMYTKQIVQIMQEYNTRHDGHICFSDKIKAKVYAALYQKITEKNDEICNLNKYDSCSMNLIIFGGVLASFSGILAIVAPIIFLTGNNRC